MHENIIERGVEDKIRELRKKVETQADMIIKMRCCSNCDNAASRWEAGVSCSSCNKLSNWVMKKAY
jgi:hypothetical protein